MSMDTPAQRLARVGAVVFERGWLSSNNVLITGKEHCALVDSGYVSHAEQTLALVRHALGQRPLDQLINTHLHSDHCGGNARLQAQYPDLETGIPPGQCAAVAAWDPVALSYEPTGQRCERFHFQRLLTPGASLRLGDHDWEIHAAPGHDPHAVLLYQAEHRILISADALWQQGFGVIFPELEGTDAFDAAEATLDLIERLAPALILPGHGPMFTELSASLNTARQRLAYFQRAPASHLRHAIKVLIKFHLLEKQQVRWQDLLQWAIATPYLRRHLFQERPESVEVELKTLLGELESAGALEIIEDRILNR